MQVDILKILNSISIKNGGEFYFLFIFFLRSSSSCKFGLLVLDLHVYSVITRWLLSEGGLIFYFSNLIFLCLFVAYLHIEHYPKG